jgi:hypothetical protein
MSTKVLLKESELISIVKRIVENIEYDELDYANAFFQIFMDWIRKNTPEKFWSYPVGFLIQKYSLPFIKDVTGDDFQSRINDDREYIINRYDLERIVKSAIKKGVYTLPSLYSEEKFTDKYKKVIPIIIENLELPEYVRLRFEEPNPNFVNVFIDVLYSNMLLSNDSKSVNSNNIERKIKNFLENFVGVEFGNPAYGEIDLKVHKINLFGIESWIKDVLNKQIKKHIRTFPEARDLKSIRFEPNSSGGIMKLIFSGYPSYVSRNALRDKVRTYLKELGFGEKIKIEL